MGTPMFAKSGFRMTALFATLVVVLSMVAVDTAEARRAGGFGGFGSRGVRTERSIPSTNVSPNATAPASRTMTNGTQQTNAAGAATQAARPGFFGGFGGALLGGFLFTGLFGMLFGAGFGGFGGMLALLFQVAIIGLIVSLFLRRRQQRPAMAGAGNANTSRFEMPSFGGSSAARTPNAQRSNASKRAGGRDEIGITDEDLGAFEQRLAQMQDAYSREDYAALRRISTPEAMSFLAEELGENATKGVRNEVFDVHLLEGDVAEAWNEGGIQYATVAMRYESRDITRNRATGEIVGGEDKVSESTEIWTFTRRNGSEWLIAAIQAP